MVGYKLKLKYLGHTINRSFDERDKYRERDRCRERTRPEGDRTRDRERERETSERAEVHRAGRS